MHKKTSMHHKKKEMDHMSKHDGMEHHEKKSHKKKHITKHDRAVDRKNLKKAHRSSRHEM